MTSPSSHTSPSTSPVTSLSRVEAEARAALISNVRYDIEVDLGGLLTGTVWRSTSTVSFTCTDPGASTFVDCRMEVQSATLNGEPFEATVVEPGRIQLPPLAAENVLVIEATQPDTDSGTGVRRVVDPSDDRVYVWTTLEPADAQRVWACFDQPDLKAPHHFTVIAPEDWLVTSCTAPAVSEPRDGLRVWDYPDTPPLSTYVVVVNAGPFHEIRSQRDGHDLGWYCRQSLARYLDRDGEELFDLTAGLLAFFGTKFDFPFPQERYNQVFVPGMTGAMENWGCVTWGESFFVRDNNTFAARHYRATVLAHEMAHMWFGDLVTMRWWDDLWLNESFASWANDWSVSHRPEYADTWAIFGAKMKPLAYRADLAPSRHAIRRPVDQVDDAMGTVDAITYQKGESVLHQLVAYVGEDAFLDGLRTYFKRHAWGNATLDDLVAAIGEAAGTDLSAWSDAWLYGVGTDQISLTGSTSEGWAVEVTSLEGEPRPHRLDIGVYRRNPDGFELVEMVPVTTSGRMTGVDLPEGDLRLVNDNDLTFASVRSDAASGELLLTEAALLPTPIARAVAMNTAVDRMLRGEIDGARATSVILDLVRRDNGVLAQDLLGQAGVASSAFTPESHRVATELAIADAAAELAGSEETRRAVLPALARFASTDAHFAVLEEATASDSTLAWATLARRAELGLVAEEEYAAVRARDDDPESAISELSARAAAPELDAKEAAWAALFGGEVAPGRIGDFSANFWRPSQRTLVEPYLARFLDELVGLQGGMLIKNAMTRIFFPVATGTTAYADAADALAASGALPDAISQLLRERNDMLRRALVARGS